MIVNTPKTVPRGLHSRHDSPATTRQNTYLRCRVSERPATIKHAAKVQPTRTAPPPIAIMKKPNAAGGGFFSAVPKGERPVAMAKPKPKCSRNTDEKHALQAAST